MSPPLAALIQSMLDPDPVTRVDATGVVEQLELLMKDFALRTHHRPDTSGKLKKFVARRAWHKARNAVQVVTFLRRMSGHVGGGAGAAGVGGVGGVAGAGGAGGAGGASGAEATAGGQVEEEEKDSQVAIPRPPQEQGDVAGVCVTGIPGATAVERAKDVRLHARSELAASRGGGGGGGDENGGGEGGGGEEVPASMSKAEKVTRTAERIETEARAMFVRYDVNEDGVLVRLGGGERKRGERTRERERSSESKCLLTML